MIALKWQTIYYNYTITIISKNEKLEFFSVRNRMTGIADNFSKANEENTCICGEKENMHHITTRF